MLLTVCITMSHKGNKLQKDERRRHAFGLKWPGKIIFGGEDRIAEMFEG